MNEAEQLRLERLVEIHRASNECEGNMLVDYLGDNGVEATLQLPPAIAPLDAVEALNGTEKMFGVFVLEHETRRAMGLVKEFLVSTVDESILEQAAARTPQEKGRL